MYSPGGRIGPPVARATYRRHTRINVAARARAAQRDAEWLTWNSKQVNAAKTSRSDAGALLSRITDRRSMAGTAPDDIQFIRTLDAGPVHCSVWLCPVTLA